MAFFFCRLIGPRPDFALSMTEDERALMVRHGAYLRGLGAKAVVFGPVLDPKGPWGLGVFEVDDEPELKRVLNGDPAIQSGLGFTYDVLPMAAGVRGGAPVQA